MIPEEIIKKVEEIEAFMISLGREVDHVHIMKTVIFNWLLENQSSCDALEDFYTKSSSTWRNLKREEQTCLFIDWVKLPYLLKFVQLEEVEVCSGNPLNMREGDLDDGF